MKKVKLSIQRPIYFILAFLFCLGISVPYFNNVVHALPATPISSWTELNTTVRNAPDGFYILTKDLTVADDDYATIGDDWTPLPILTGSFDGGGFEIQGLTVTTGSGDIGFLRGIGAGASVSNLGLTSLNINTASGGEVGGLAGTSQGDVDNVYITGTIISTSGYDTGGLISNMSAGSVSDSYTSLEITASQGYAGGLIGYIDGSGSISVVNSYATGMVDGDGGSYVGGLVGSTAGGTINISGCYATGEAKSITGGVSIGGLVGEVSPGATIENSYAKGNVSGVSQIGGLVGSNSGKILKSYSTGVVTGTGSNIGGLAGRETGSSVNENNFSTGNVTGSNYVGAFIGQVNGSSLPVNAYWYKAGSLDYCYHDGSENPGNTGCTQKTDLNWFKGNSTNQPMASWDFATVWATKTNDFPILKWQVPADTTLPTFSNLPGLSVTININEGQTITTNPYLINVKPTDNVSIQRVEFLVDGTLICTDTTADIDGVYSCSWDTSRYHSSITVYAYDGAGNRSLALTRNATVDPALYMSVLPATGKR